MLAITVGSILHDCQPLQEFLFGGQLAQGKTGLRIFWGLDFGWRRPEGELETSTNLAGNSPGNPPGEDATVHGFDQPLKIANTIPIRITPPTTYKTTRPTLFPMLVCWNGGEMALPQTEQILAPSRKSWPQLEHFMMEQYR
jgi:hypothetical protein